LDVNADSPDLQAQAESLLSELTAEFPLNYAPELRWRPLRVSAGYANHREGIIGLSTILLTEPERLRRTLFHEYAHLLAVARQGRRAAGHGLAWKQAMLDLGERPVVRHDYPVKRNSPRQQVEYRCERCGTLIVRKRRLPKSRRYLHTGCGGLVRFAAAKTLTPPDAVP
jgi:predicted SprT family Zn-dependent metalloprotease